MVEKHKAPEVLVVGAGIFGLSCALACAERGMAVTVLERFAPGAGASGGVVGALSPFLPAPWNPKKQAQLDALVAGEAYWGRIAEISGHEPGYARVGRLIPLATAEARERAAEMARGAAEVWPEPFTWELVAPADLPGWIARDAAPFGAVRETLSARLTPRAALAAQVGALSALGGRLQVGTEVVGLADGGVRTAEGMVRAEAIVLATGSGGADLTEGVIGRKVAGRHVKGQAALIACDQPRMPLIFSDGLYVVAHGDGSVAVGSTSESSWASPDETDGELEDLIARARMLCPDLARAPVALRWAGLRPRAPRPDPLIGPLPGAPGVFVADGGYKIGFGMAPAVGEAIAGMIAGEPSTLPASFAPAAHGLG